MSRNCSIVFTFRDFLWKIGFDYQFFWKKPYFSTKDTIFMSELLPNENGFKGKKGPNVIFLPITKTPLLHTPQIFTKVHFKMSLVYKV